MMKKSLRAILFLFSILELIIFPSLINMYGCIITILSLELYLKFVFSYKNIKYRPLSFLAITLLFLFMYLPLPVTLLEGKPISFKMAVPVTTFTLQFIYYSITIWAFYISRNFYKKNRWLCKKLYQFGYFTPPVDKQIWILSSIGILAKIYLAANQYGEEVTFAAGTMNIISTLSYLPICLLYKDIYSGSMSKKSKKVILLYVLFLSIFGIATNQRSQVITIWGIWLLIHLIYMTINHKWKSFFQMKKIILVFLGVFIVSGPLSDLAFAMIVIRTDRTELSAYELLESTIELCFDRERLYAAKQIYKNSLEKGWDGQDNINLVWNEYYVDNIFLDRFCNYRVVDAAIYHAQRVGYGNHNMQNDFVGQLKTLFPQPITELLFGDIDKMDYYASTMDVLLFNSTKSIDWVSKRVGGDVGLGLAVFGYFYFIIQLLVYIATFYVLDSKVMMKKNKLVIPVLTLIGIYSSFLTFQVAGGIIGRVKYLIWGFFYSTALILIVYKFTLIITNKFHLR